MSDIRPRKASTTAILVAAVRASHLRWNRAPIFSDQYAVELVTPFWRLVAHNWLLNRIVVDVLLRTLKPTHTVIILRIRYSEDRLHEAISAGVRQYVVLGAGLDTFALRHQQLAHRLRVYEVDHPASQEMKRQQLGRIDGSPPSNLHFVPVDFETDRLDEALIRAGFDREAPAFFSWLGVTCYLTEEAVTDTIGQIAAVAAPGSRMVLDYRYPRRIVPDDGLALVEKMDRFVERRGEPMLSEYSPEEIDAELERAGFTAMDHVSPTEQVLRYLQERRDIPEPPPNFAFALFEKSSRTR
jgi:methyltransferase (TIGR00027 family)